MNRYERKRRGKLAQMRRFMRYTVRDGLAYKSPEDYLAHLPESEAYYNSRPSRAKPPERRCWQHHTTVNKWKTCQKKHANKRIRGIYNGGREHDGYSLPRFSGYKRVHELVIY